MNPGNMNPNIPMGQPGISNFPRLPPNVPMQPGVAIQPNMHMNPAMQMQMMQQQQQQQHQPLTVEDEIHMFLYNLSERPLLFPDHVLKNILEQSGATTSDSRVFKLISFACQTYLDNIAAECRHQSPTPNLQVGDVKRALAKFNVSIDRPEYIMTPLPPEVVEDEQDNEKSPRSPDFIQNIWGNGL